MKSRIKQIRQDLKINISQEAFGARISVTAAGISKIESGQRNASDQREYGLSEADHHILAEFVELSLAERKAVIGYMRRVVDRVNRSDATLWIFSATRMCPMFSALRAWKILIYTRKR